MAKDFLYDSDYARDVLIPHRNRVKKDKKGNVPGAAFKNKGEHLPPTMCGFNYTGKTTQLSNGKIVPQKKSER